MEYAEKGRAFDGWVSGKTYDTIARMLGVGEVVQEAALEGVDLGGVETVLDLGCGTGGFGLFLCDRIRNTDPDAPVELFGMDIAEPQLAEARRKGEGREYPTTFAMGSMDDTGFPEDRFDVILSSMAFHEVAPAVRRTALPEIHRILKPGGRFILLDWSKPRFGLQSFLWLPFLFYDGGEDNRKNRYPALCRKAGLIPDSDRYVNSLIRCQIFKKRNG